MFTAVVYVCLNAIPGWSCDSSNASMVIHAPPARGQAECLLSGQAVAATGMVPPGHYPKIACRGPRYTRDLSAGG